MKNPHYKRDWMRKWRAEHPQAAMNQARRSSQLLRKKPLSEEEKQKRLEGIIAWQKKYPERARAHQKVYYAVKTGKLFRKPCWCGAIKVEAHHFDYSKPLEVEWVCRPHHELADKVRQISEVDNLPE